MIRAVIFDRDHTLLRYDEAGLLHRFRRIIPALTLSELYRCWGGLPRDVADSTEAVRALWRSIQREHPCSPEEVEQLIDITSRYHTAYSPYPDTVACLETLMRQGIKLAVLTNHPNEHVHLTLRQAGVDPDWFDCLVTAHPERKPAPAAYVRVADRLGLMRPECLFVDDEPANVRGAAETGMHAVLIDRSGGVSTFAPAVGSLLELTDLVFGIG